MAMHAEEAGLLPVDKNIVFSMPVCSLAASLGILFVALFRAPFGDPLGASLARGIQLGVPFVALFSAPFGIHLILIRGIQLGVLFVALL